MARSEPVVDGFVQPDFAEVIPVLRSIIGSYGGGAGVCAYFRGRCVVDLWGGTKDPSGAPWQRDTMAPSFSTTKGIASTLLHMMVDRGLLRYDDRVAVYWPEFAQAGKERITIRQVLSHQSGLYHIRQMIDHADRMLDWEHMIAAIERTPPIHPPGERTGYHGLTYGFLVGEILRRVTGKPFPELVRSELAEPLRLDGMYIGAPNEALPRTAQLMWPRFGIFGPQLLALEGSLGGTALMQGSRVLGMALRLFGLQLDLESIIDALAPRGINAFDFGSPETLRAAIPAANGLFTARSLAKTYAALANNGELEGVRLLSPKTLGRATRIQDATAHRLVIPWDMRWRLGYHGVATTAGVPRRAFGHFGFGGSGAWADPKRNLSVALIVNSGFGTPFGDLRILRIGGAVLTCANRVLARPHPRRTVAMPVRRRVAQAAAG